MSIELNDQNFSTILNEEKPVMIDFFATWCGPCQLSSPMIDELSEEFKESLVIGKIDVDENPDSVTQYGIKSLPTLIFFKNGKVMDKQEGSASKQKIIEKIKKQLG